MVRRIRNIPTTALMLGVAGVVPFVSLAVVLLIYEKTFLQSLLLLKVYSAVILSFLGGVRWGIAIHGKSDLSESEQRLQLILSILPSFVAWLALLVSDQISLLILAVAFSALLILDWFSGARGLFPIWYVQLRIPLSFGAVSALLVTMLALSSG